MESDQRGTRLVGHIAFSALHLVSNISHVFDPQEGPPASYSHTQSPSLLRRQSSLYTCSPTKQQVGSA